MHIWSMWLDAIQWMLGALSSEAGMGLGLAIVIGTLILRSLLLPISWSIACRNFIRSMKLQRLKPRLDSLRSAARHPPPGSLRGDKDLTRSRYPAIPPVKPVDLARPRPYISTLTGNSCCVPGTFPSIGGQESREHRRNRSRLSKYSRANNSITSPPPAPASPYPATPVDRASTPGAR